MQHTASSHTPLKTAGFAHPESNVGALGIEPGMNVADFGSGSGAYVHAIAAALEGFGHVYAIDIQKDLLRRIHNEAGKRGHKNVMIIWSDLELPKSSKIADSHIDLVLISNLLFQVEDKRVVLEEAHRILKPTGRLAIIDWTESFGGMGPIKEHVFSKKAAMEIASTAGFAYTTDFPAGAHHYGLIMRKVIKTNV